MNLELLKDCDVEVFKEFEELQVDNERLKAELKKWEDRSKVVKDGYDGEVYEWEDNYYIVTPHLNVFVKGLLREKARLHCLALHAMCEYFYAMHKRFLLIDRYRYYAIKYREAYRKAKKELQYGKID